MPQPLTLATLSVLAAAGSITGIYLGRSAIAEIDPIYYDEPESRFHADLVPNPPGFEAPAVRQAGYVSPAEYGAALGDGCVGCRTYPEEYYPVHDSSVDKYQPGYAELVEAPEAQAAAAQQAEGAAAELAFVERYAEYEIEAGTGEDAPGAAAVELASADAPVTE